MNRMKLLFEDSTMKPYIDAHTEPNQWGMPIVNYELLPFHDKATYLKWRAMWRQTYASLSNYIRIYKVLRKHPKDETKSDAQSTTALLASYATAMLAQRKFSKAKATLQSRITPTIQTDQTTPPPAH